MNRILEAQSEIIRIQSECIKELFELLGQHKAVEELDNLKVIDKINLAADLRAEIIKERL